VLEDDEGADEDAAIGDGAATEIDKEAKADKEEGAVDEGAAAGDDETAVGNGETAAGNEETTASDETALYGEQAVAGSIGVGIRRWAMVVSWAARRRGTEAAVRGWKVRGGREAAADDNEEAVVDDEEMVAISDDYGRKR
jgi:hypothetical protein